MISNSRDTGAATATASAIRLDVEAPDSPEARACRNAYFAELRRRFVGGFEEEAGGSAGDLDMTPPNGAFLVARLDGRPVGCGGFVSLSPDIAEIKRMWTSEAARGRGIARCVLTKLERIARRAGYSAVRLDTNRALLEAQAFYRRDGYGEIERYNANPYADLWFEKRLT